MLHFLAAVALLIFIGERIEHYLRVQREERRAIERFYPPQPAPPSPNQGLARAIISGTIAGLGVAGALFGMAG